MSKGQEKRERVHRVISREEADRVPIFDAFSTEFLELWRRELGLGPDVDIYRYYDLDIKLICPNIDPHLISSEIIKRDDKEVVFRSGFGCTVRKVFSRIEQGYIAAMPQFIEFPIKDASEYARFQFDDPAHPGRYWGVRTDFLSGDGYTPLPPFVDALAADYDDFCIWGNVCDPFETLWRVRGPEDALVDLVLNPAEVKEFAERTTDFMIETGKEQIKHGVSGIFIFGDVAYHKGMLFSPKIWREIFFPCLSRMCHAFHSLGVYTIYHGCGANPDQLIEWLIEAGVDALDPLEVKAGMDVVALKAKFGDCLSFVGGIDNHTALPSPDQRVLAREIERKLEAAKGGGYIIGSDHSLPATVPPANYEFYLRTVRELGRYPLAE